MSMNLSVQQRAAASAPTPFGAEPGSDRSSSAASPFAGLLGEQQRLVASHGQNGNNAFAAPPAPAPSKANPPEHRAEAARRPEPRARAASDEAKPIEKDTSAAKRAAAKDGVAPPAAKAPAKPVDGARRTADAASDEAQTAGEPDTALAEPAGEAVDDTPAADAADAAVAAQAPAAPDPKVMLDWLARWGAAPPSAREAGSAATLPADPDATTETAATTAASGVSAAGVDSRPSAVGPGEADTGRQRAGTDPLAAAAGEKTAAGAVTEPSATQALHAAHADAQAQARADARAVAADALLLPANAGPALAAAREFSPAALTATEPSRGAQASERARVGELLPASLLGGLAMPSAPASGLPGGPLPLSVATPVNSPDFSQALATQLTTLARDGVHEAELQLNPADMGPIAVQIVIDGAQAQIDFTASQAGTRQALEASLPALAAALNGAGLTLSGGGVFEQRSGGREGAADGERRAGGRSETIALGGSEGATGVSPRTTRGLLDLYA